MKKEILLVCTALIFFSGCQVAPPQLKVAVLTLYDKTNGVKWVGTVQGLHGSNSGEAFITIDNDSYHGDWFDVKSGGGASVSSSYGNSFTTLTQSASGIGQIHLYADHGKFITCNMVANSLSRTVMGECKRNDGRKYDLFIKV
jgi:hypothetical protein